MTLAKRTWLTSCSEELVQATAAAVEAELPDETAYRLSSLIEQNRTIHDINCINLNPAANVTGPDAERALAAGLGGRPSLGHPGAKYEFGLEAVEQIEIIAASLAAAVFSAAYAEVRVLSGAMANLAVFMATCHAGDTIIVPPPSIGGHVTHHTDGCAGLYGATCVPAPIDADTYSVDLQELRRLALHLRPKLITIGGSLNLLPHPVRELRDIADDAGALLMFDAAHVSGLIAGEEWPNPLGEGAHVMTMSTYKSLGGPAAGLILTNSAELAQRLERVIHPGLTANFDAAKTASLAFTLLDWKRFGRDYAQAMVAAARALGTSLAEHEVPVFATRGGITRSHQLAVEAHDFGGGHAACAELRRANILASGIELPMRRVEGDFNGIRLGTPEIVRWGMTQEHMPQIASFIADALLKHRPSLDIAADVTSFRSRFKKLNFVTDTLPDDSSTTAPLTGLPCAASIQQSPHGAQLNA